MKKIVIILFILFISLNVFTKNYPEKCMPSGYIKGKITWHIYIMPYTKMDYWVLKQDRNGKSISCKGE